MKEKPDVIFDVIFERGLLFFTIHNIGSAPACDVSIKFDCEIRGIGGSKPVSEMPLFRMIRFMPPGKEITTFVDTSASYFRNEQPVQIEAYVIFHDRRGKCYTNRIRHDLAIYQDIGYIERNKVSFE